MLKLWFGSVLAQQTKTGRGMNFTGIGLNGKKYAVVHSASALSGWRTNRSLIFGNIAN